MTAAEPRGWRLGGGATYGALVGARLGLRVGAILGLDELTRDAPELSLLRAAGVEIVPVMLRSVPVFENVETPDGRIQWCHDPGESILPDHVPDAWRGAPAWLLSPMADELPDEWATVSAGGHVTLGWQGLLRDLVPGERVMPRGPRPSALLRAASIVGLSVGDVDPVTVLADLAELVRPGARLVLTHGSRGGLLAEAGRARDGHGLVPRRSWPVVRARRIMDATGAGDSFLAAFAAATLLLASRGGSSDAGASLAGSLRFAAAVASLVVEGVGLSAVPTRAAVARRLTEEGIDAVR